MKTSVLIFSLLIIIIQTNCSTEPEDELKLFIQNGYYSKFITSDGEIRYSVDFDYGVTSDTCYIGGYGFQWNEESNSGIHWYIMQKIEPGRTYSIRDTFKFSETISSGPIVSMQGHLEVLMEADDRLKADYRLRNK